MEIKSKKELLKVVMLNSRKYWNVNDLTIEMQQQCKKSGFTFMRMPLIERYIREFREPRYSIIVRKKKVGSRTYLYKIESIKI